MALASGTRLGPYTIAAPLGAGGMGEVYKAADTRLDRIVAIKVLPEHVASDPELKQRFEREAKTLAALNHPHICDIYDVGSQAGIDYLVMEHLEGETLAQRLAKGALPLEQALQVAIQIADALDKAHRKGIVHRDLKPGNIMLTKSGAKLLDFGLAKLRPMSMGGGVGLSAAPTVSSPLTGAGAILGTFQYMAPEQLEGQDADARTDIFAFGAIVYELITGKRAFEGKSQASLIAAILERDPAPMSSLQPVAPPALDRVVKKCLAKDPDRRWQTARDLHDELQWVAECSLRDDMQTGGTSATARNSGWHSRGVTTSIALALLVAAGLGWVLRGRIGAGAVAAPPTVARVSIPLPDGDELGDQNNPAIAVSPTGTHIAFVTRSDGRQRLFVRPIDSQNATALAGTDLAQAPFFSPDGQWVGFFAQGKLKKVSLGTGALQTLTDAPGARGGSWGDDGAIYFAPTNTAGLMKVSADGGMPVQVTSLDVEQGEISHRWPQVLPGSNVLMFTTWTGIGDDEKRIDVQRLDTGERIRVVDGGDTGRFVASGHVVFGRGDQLFAQPFDLTSLSPRGSPTRLPDAIRSGTEGQQFAVSDAGVLVYMPGDPRRREYRLAWAGRDGRVDPLSAPPRFYTNPSISPDGRRAAVTIDQEIWLYDLARETLSPLTTGVGGSQAVRWTPDGERLVYRATRAGTRNLWWKVVDGSANEERLTSGPGNWTPVSWTADGQWLFGGTAGDIFVLRLERDRQPELIVETPFLEGHAQVSPDGRWLAYTSNESQRTEVYVQAYPVSSGRLQVTTEGGDEPTWSRNSRELFYWRGDQMMAVDMAALPVLQGGTPRVLFRVQRTRSGLGLPGYDVAADGRFLIVQPLHPDPPMNQINVVLNWTSELQRLVPTR